ncbi:MAG: hypothetical protein AAGG75_20125 [Bacteroidota bacterium]
MPEFKVRLAAVDYLRKRYQARARRGRVYWQEEARTQRRYGGKRADGLVVFRHLLWGTYVVSMEAKSFRTLSAIKPRGDLGQLLGNALKAGLVFCLLSGAYAALFKMDDGFIQFFLPLHAFLIGAILYSILTYKSTRHRVMGVIRQLRQYPANEQWLAFSRDSLKALSRRQRQQLERICRYKGVGLLLVSSARSVEVRVKPRRQWKWWGGFLCYYSNAKKIRHFLR